MQRGMEKNMENNSSALGLREFRDTAKMMENQLESKMRSEMETQGLFGGVFRAK